MHVNHACRDTYAKTDHKNDEHGEKPEQNWALLRVVDWLSDGSHIVSNSPPDKQW